MQGETTDEKVHEGCLPEFFDSGSGIVVLWSQTVGVLESAGRCDGAACAALVRLSRRACVVDSAGDCGWICGLGACCGAADDGECSGLSTGTGMIASGRGAKKRPVLKAQVFLFDGSGDQMPDAVEAVSAEALASSS